MKINMHERLIDGLYIRKAPSATFALLSMWSYGGIRYQKLKAYPSTRCLIAPKIGD